MSFSNPIVSKEFENSVGALALDANNKMNTKTY
jgi:hypothetical protein